MDLKLKKILRLTGSSNDNEALLALRTATKYLAAKGKYLEDLDLIEHEKTTSELKTQIDDLKDQFNKQLGEEKRKFTAELLLKSKKDQQIISEQKKELAALRKELKNNTHFDSQVSLNQNKSLKSLSLSCQIKPYIEACNLKKGVHWVSSSLLRKHFTETTEVETNSALFNRIFSETMGNKASLGGVGHSYKGFLLNKSEESFATEIEDPSKNSAKEILNT